MYGAGCPTKSILAFQMSKASSLTSSVYIIRLHVNDCVSRLRKHDGSFCYHDTQPAANRAFRLPFFLLLYSFWA